MTQQDTGKFRTNTADKFYTKESVAVACVNHILSTCPTTASDSWLWVEPSAGSGIFLRAAPSNVRQVGVDIEPGAPGILKGDFLMWTLPAAAAAGRDRVLVFGNPPFGRQGSLAKKFIVRAAEFADVIAFILPRSFVKPSMSRSFPLNFHCLFSEELAENSFEVNGTAYDVPCIFQIWEKRTENRHVEAGVGAVGFTYVRSAAEAHVAFRRVGVNAGHCFTINGTQPSPQSHYFLHVHKKYVDAGLLELLVVTVSEYEFPSNTVGPRSLSKGEVNAVLNEVLAGFDELI
jgi:hypothetical protein